MHHCSIKTCKVTKCWIWRSNKTHLHHTITSTATRVAFRPSVRWKTAKESSPVGSGVKLQARGPTHQKRLKIPTFTCYQTTRPRSENSDRGQCFRCSVSRVLALHNLAAMSEETGCRRNPHRRSELGLRRGALSASPLCKRSTRGCCGENSHPANGDFSV